MCAKPGLLFFEQDGEPVSYITSQGEELLKGSVRIDASEAGPSGILCACCNTVISCSQFEAHAGRGSRRAPYDNIFTAGGVSLRKLASFMPASNAESPTAHHTALSAVADRSPPQLNPNLLPCTSIMACCLRQPVCTLAALFTAACSFVKGRRL